MQKNFDGTKQLLYSQWFDKDGKFSLAFFVLLVVASVSVLCCSIFSVQWITKHCDDCSIVKGNSIGTTEGGFPANLGTWETISVSFDTGSVVPATVQLYVGHPLQSTTGHVEVRQVTSNRSVFPTLSMLFWLMRVELACRTRSCFFHLLISLGTFDASRVSSPCWIPSTGSTSKAEI